MQDVIVMQLLVNGNPVDSEAQVLNDLLHELDFDSSTVATAVNQEFVAKQDRPTCKLSNGDTIEILSPMQGG